MTQQTRPKIQKDSNYEPIQNSYSVEQTFRGEYTGTNLIYRGYAIVGSDEGELVWQIAKLAYDGSNNVLSIKWPLAINGTAASSDYNFSWTNRATYTYV